MASAHDMRAVDDLLNMTVPGKRQGITAPAPVEDAEEVTGVYNVQFFEGRDAKRPEPAPLTHLADARIGLDLFLAETTRALEVNDNELTADQRIHIATIAGFIEALGARFDRIRVPGYVQKGIRVRR